MLITAFTSLVKVYLQVSFLHVNDLTPSLPAQRPQFQRGLLSYPLVKRVFVEVEAWRAKDTGMQAGAGV